MTSTANQCSDRADMNDWGLLPDAIHAQIMQREWNNANNMRGRLSGDRAFPLRISLKAPTGAQALTNLQHFRLFINSWKQWTHPHLVQWQQKKYQRLGEQHVPVSIQITSMPELITVLGAKAKARSQRWEQMMRPLLNLDARMSPILIRHLAALETMRPDDTSLLAQLIPQLQAGMGQGHYLRALPLHDVDTKFVESYQTLIADLLDSLHDNAVTQQGGLLLWLNCCANPAGWLQIRPLCQQSQQQLANLPLLQLDTATLIHYPLPASRILIVENKQSGYALPDLDDTIAVFGGGRNTAWMQAEWLQHKRIGYWGDIDSWGLAILSEARKHQPHLQALMMDAATVLQFQTRMVNEETNYSLEPEYLTEAEQLLFCHLNEGYYSKTRLEQERLAADYVYQCLLQWHQS